MNTRMHHSRNSTVVQLLAVVVFLLGAWSASAQEAPKAPTSDADMIATLTKQVAELKAQNQKLAAGPALTPEERLKRDQEAYAQRFKAARDVARDGCRRAGGRLHVLIDAAGKVSLDCELR